MSRLRCFSRARFENGQGLVFSSSSCSSPCICAVHKEAPNQVAFRWRQSQTPSIWASRRRYPSNNLGYPQVHVLEAPRYTLMLVLGEHRNPHLTIRDETPFFSCGLSSQHLFRMFPRQLSWCSALTGGNKRVIPVGVDMPPTTMNCVRRMFAGGQQNTRALQLHKEIRNHGGQFRVVFRKPNPQLRSTWSCADLIVETLPLTKLSFIQT